MSDPTLIHALGSSPLTQYVDLLVRVPHELRDLLNDGKLPPSRMRQYLQEIEPAIDRSFREALDEARKDATAAAIAGKLDTAQDAVENLLQIAYAIAQGGRSEADFQFARSQLAGITSKLMHRTRPVGQVVPEAIDPTHHKPDPAKRKSTVRNSKKRKKVGRRPATAAEKQADADLVAEWERARETKVYKAVFAREKSMTVKELDRVVSRVKRRETRSNK